ncbi:MAG: hypothetical protein MSH25_02430 [Desulfovibrio sp.]|uniref:hypothetical protein n=1 Tax=Desulfovibrio sp. TaxID=885 RepID=UPI0025C33ECB|nr:hypothetical protein [Desulfovibrio sp.]MCI7568219.1 hypothetical protein [Desulfovibrio sp.]
MTVADVLLPPVGEKETAVTRMVNSPWREGFAVADVGAAGDASPFYSGRFCDTG